MEENNDKLPTSLEDFQNYIDSNNILSRKEFRSKNKYLYNRYIRLFSKEERILNFKEEFYHHFEDSLKTVEDFQKFIDDNDIKRPVDFRNNYPKEYDRLCRALTKDEKKNLVYKVRINSYSDIISEDNLQDFITNNEIIGRKDLHKRFPGLYVKFSKQLDNIKFIENSLSIGANFLKRLFIENNINFITEKTYPDLRNILPLRYDFYLTDLNILIEHHGEEHFGKGRYYNESVINNDKTKYEYAIKNNIPILYFTIYKSIYEKFGYFTDVITDPNILINKIKEIDLTNQSLNDN